MLACVALLFGAVDSASKLLHPYQELVAGRLNNWRTLDFDPMNRISIVAIAYSLMHRHWVLALVMLLSVLNPLLTIAAGGLYTSSLVPSIYPVQLLISDWFDIRNASSAGLSFVHLENTAPSNDAVISLGIQYNNLSFPRGTYDEFAFASINVGSPPMLMEPGMSTALQVALPAARGEINCTAWPIEPATPNPWLPASDVIPAIPPGCSAGADFANLTTMSLTRPYGGVPSQGYFAYWADIEWGPGGGLGHHFGSQDSFEACHDGRQHLFFFYGHLTEDAWSK